MKGLFRKKWLRAALVVVLALIAYGSFRLYLSHELRVICEKPRISDAELKRAKRLLDLGADPNQQFLFSNQIPFEEWLFACRPLSFDLMESWRLYNDRNHDLLFIALLDHGADPNAQDAWQESKPLLSCGFNLEVEKALLKHGGRLGNNMQTALGTWLEVEKRGNKEEIELFRAAYEKEKQKP
jgi:hypothetical protein